MKYICDLQGFKSIDNEFIVKEIAFVPVEDGESTVFLFKPPNSREVFKRMGPSTWLENNYHGLLWNSGDIPFEEAEKILQAVFHADSDDIYVKGVEKTKWLKKLLPERCIYNLEDLGCPSLKKLSMTAQCSNHVMYLNAVCAKKNVEAIRTWIIEQRRRKMEEFLHFMILDV